MKWTKYHIELALFYMTNLSGANLSGANLFGANLSEANLSGANLSGADLSKADLSWANLYWANLSGANLSKANLSGANLSKANLSGANLSGANLSGANLFGANLSRASLQKTKLPIFQILPETGSFKAFKKLKGNIVIEIEIPARAKRTSLVGRKCRAEYVKVIKGRGFGIYDDTRYRQGKIVRADKWDDDIRVECTHGVHFFMTRKETEDYNN